MSEEERAKMETAKDAYLIQRLAWIACGALSGKGLGNGAAYPAKQARDIARDAFVTTGRSWSKLA